MVIIKSSLRSGRVSPGSDKGAHRILQDLHKCIHKTTLKTNA